MPGGPCNKELGGGSIEEHDKIGEVDGKEHSKDNLSHVSTHCHCRNGMIPDACAQILAQHWDALWRGPGRAVAELPRTRVPWFCAPFQWSSSARRAAAPASINLHSQPCLVVDLNSQLHQIVNPLLFPPGANVPGWRGPRFGNPVFTQMTMSVLCRRCVARMLLAQVCV